MRSPKVARLATVAAGGALAALVLLSLAAAAPGNLDPAFAGKGWRQTREFFPVGTPQEYMPKGAQDIALQADGKIVLTGEIIGHDSDWYFGAYRFTAAGDLDRSFGEGGFVATKFGSFDETHAVAIQRDGKILLAGQSVCQEQHFCGVIVRYLPNGALDRSFGGTGIVHIHEPRMYGADDVAVQPNGRIVLLGYQDNRGQDRLARYFSVARFLPNGRLDRSFSHDGVAQLGQPGGQYGTAMTLQRDGKIVVVGTGSADPDPVPNTSFFEIARFRADGRPDRSFSRNGIATVNFHGRDESATGVAVRSDGRIVVVGTAGVFVKTKTNRIALVRLTRNGSLDRSFGKRLTDPGPYGGEGGDVLIGPGGRVLVAGTAYDKNAVTGSSWATVRYLPNGRRDASFGRRGVVLGNFGTGTDWASSLVFQLDGKLLVGGSVSEDEAVARYVMR
jgi:uncharacterized delta-60 repeat protein